MMHEIDRSAVRSRPMAGAAELMARDPMLLHAMDAHGGEWRPDLHATTKHAMDTETGLPEVELTTTRHQMAWSTPEGLVRRDQQWRDGRWGNGTDRSARWDATATIPDRWPETVLASLPGRGLDEVVDLPGAEAWIVDAVARVPGFHVDLVLERAR